MDIKKEFKTIEVNLNTYGNFSEHSVQAIVDNKENNNGFKDSSTEIITFSFRDQNTLLIGYYLTYDVDKVLE